MNLDLRVPMGLMFLLVGVILFAYGLQPHAADFYAKSLDINVNRDWGAVLAVFGLTMYIFGTRSQRRIAAKGNAAPTTKTQRKGH